MMGVKKNISADSWPKQGAYLGKDVDVCFHYDTSCVVQGVVVRDDVEEPCVCIIRLESGRYVLSTECMYSVRR